MKLSAEQLAGHLQQTHAPVYLVSGDEPLLSAECCDQLRSAFRDKGFSEREVLHVEGHFKWEYLLECANALSLFAEQKLIEIRVGSHKINKAAGDIIQEYIAHAPPENILLIIAEKLDGAAKKSAWHKAIEQKGVCVEIWPVEINQLPGWIRHRAMSKNMQLDDSAIQLLCDRVEGNLLAAKQELDKLHLLHPTGTLSAEQIVNAVSDSSRYDVYALMDTIALGQGERCIKILNVLRQEGIEPPIVLWALTREIRTLYAIRQGIERGLAYETICQKERIWGKRKQTLKRCAERLSISTLEDLLKTSQDLDKVIKGMGTGSPWLMLSDIAITLSGKRLQLSSFS
ncbi:DNA polymerase III subunit delta [Neptunomonas qingdaonensis]|uniref:DNA polymerase III subunit delta n=1 Tax=Neptunomonas qingdaonensis TaxID=1045558 RepID=A0A1I2NAI7_9GAMM|nr:DNA polymerase III subunit delta [Neptunomonas qingdaonensis]SFG00874.1 DNA polymerase III, delta subunit [Neptunomonas qingdaonensis]